MSKVDLKVFQHISQMTFKIIKAKLRENGKNILKEAFNGSNLDERYYNEGVWSEYETDLQI